MPEGEITKESLGESDCVRNKIKELILFGDSYTKSYHEDLYLSWPYFITRMPDFQGIPIHNHAYTTSTMDQFAHMVPNTKKPHIQDKFIPWADSGLKQQLHDRKRSDFERVDQEALAVVIWMGLNDLSKIETAEPTLKRYRENLKYLQEDLGFTRGRLYMANLPPFEDIPLTRNNETKVKQQRKFNEELVDLVKEPKPETTLVDVHSVVKKMFMKDVVYNGIVDFTSEGCRETKDCFWADDVHPSAQAALPIANVFANAIRESLGCPQVPGQGIYIPDEPNPGKAEPDSAPAGGTASSWLLTVIVVGLVCMILLRRKVSSLLTRRARRWGTGKGLRAAFNVELLRLDPNDED